MSIDIDADSLSIIGANSTNMNSRVDEGNLKSDSKEDEQQTNLIDTKTPLREKQTILIGDVHGCYEELKELLIRCDYQHHVDSLIFVGDLVGKGPFESEVVEFVMTSGAKCVKGNWEYSTCKSHRKRESKVFTSAQIQWLEDLPYYLEIPEHNIVVVHAGLVPDRPLSQQVGYDMMTMRSLVFKDDGKQVSTTSKHEQESWVKYWKGPQFVVFGHDARRGLQQTPFALGIDTACVYGKQLTAYVLPQRKLVQVEAKQRYCAKGYDTNTPRRRKSKYQEESMIKILQKFMDWNQETVITHTLILKELLALSVIMTGLRLVLRI